ncbi:DHA2 family efflux MFS transporter permease subunit [Amycolatopsis jiangsuensis]|uniref:EmrB/QacA subfamily drug resistance transporter n=1 Tax=Amycolatopsis jiangsuensis TaxID=1181879 RepID=A0A840J4Z7_9PSEU|nr:DHA2 family efflux MFS transporter permease subunit [Amycolatopsis jiangsuensis]MBB4688695.1 EmrB/QacA subfamily drug resistance transporter [Amycolatopsis jiangsuensis]
MRGERLVVVLACVCVFAVILDATIVAVALPGIRGELGFGEAGIGWVVTGYTLVFAGFQLLGGRCADVYGLRRVLYAGLVVFGVGSVLAGLAPNAWLLLAARAVQGLGGALLVPTALACITTVVPDGARRASALATWSMVGAVGAASGTVLGGVLTQAAGWRWVFLINVPIVVLAAALVRPALPPHGDGTRRPLDLPGALLVTAGLTLVVYAISGSGTALTSWLPGAAGVLLLSAFLGWEHRGREPMLPLRLFRVRTVSAANLTMFAIGLAFFATPILLSLYLQGVLGYSPLQAGLAFAPSSVLTLAGGRLAGRVTPRWGLRRASVAGSLIAAAGFGLLAVLTETAAPYVLGVGIPVAVVGFGIGLAFTPITVAATRGVEPGYAGIAAGLLNTTRQTSGAAGVAVLTAISTAAGDHGAHGYAVAFAVTFGCAAAAALLAALLLPGTSAAVAPPVAANR